MEVASWNHPATQMPIDVVEPGVDTRFLTPGREWEMLEANTEDHTAYFQGIPFKSAYLYISLKRHPGHYQRILFTPIAITTGLSNLAFSMTRDNDRLSFCLTAYLTLVASLFVGSRNIPASNNPTYVAMYFTLRLILSSIPMVFSAVQLVLIRRAEQLPGVQDFISVSDKFGFAVSIVSFLVAILWLQTDPPVNPRNLLSVASTFGVVPFALWVVMSTTWAVWRTKERKVADVETPHRHLPHFTRAATVAVNPRKSMYTNS